MKNTGYRKLTLSALFLCLGIALPMLIGQVPQIGSMLLPMHIPVFLCAFICGPYYGAPMAAILPILRSVLFNRPNFYPEALAIAFELASYALIAGALYSRFKKQNTAAVLLSLSVSLVAGRIVRGLAQFFLLKAVGASFDLVLFLKGTVLISVPGIILQLIIIPLVLMLLKKKKIF